MSISGIARVGHPTLAEYSSGHRAETFGLRRCRLELGEWNDEALARVGILDLGTPVGHAHGIVSAQHEDTSVIEDSVADSH